MPMLLMINPTVVGSSERDNLGHIPPYVKSHVHDRGSYSSIGTEVNGESAGVLTCSCAHVCLVAPRRSAFPERYEMVEPLRIYES